MSMKFALSTLALPPGDHRQWLARLPAWGFAGVVLVPSRLWADWPDPAQVALYRRAVEQAGLAVAALHVPAGDYPLLNLLAGEGAGEEGDPAAHLLRLSALARDLGASTLVIGHGRWRRELPMDGAWARCFDLLDRVLPVLERQGVQLCFEPLGPGDGDFCTRASECRILTNAVDHPALGLQLNARALVENGESGHSVFAAIYGRLESFTVNEPGLLPLASTGRVDHAAMRRHLAASGYEGWVVLEQKFIERGFPDGLEQSAALLLERYCRQDNLSLARHDAAFRAAPGVALLH